MKQIALIESLRAPLLLALSSERYSQVACALSFVRRILYALELKVASIIDMTVLCSLDDSLLAFHYCCVQVVLLHLTLESTMAAYKHIQDVSEINGSF